MEMEADMDIGLGTSRKGLQGRVLMANSLCLSFRDTLDALSADLLKPDGNRLPSCAEEAQAARKIEEAGMELGLALANIGAARHIALRGGAAPPSSSAARLEPMDDDLAGDQDVESALKLIKEAETLATHTHDWVEAARGHLAAVALLRALNDGDGGGAPWEHSSCLAEWLDAVLELVQARLSAVDLVDATVAASKAALGSSGGTD